MSESSEYEKCGLDTFKEETSSKMYKEESVNVKEAESDINSSTSPIAYGEDKGISSLGFHAEASIASAKSMESATVSTGKMKTSNPAVSTALNGIFETYCGEGSSSGHRAGLTHEESALLFVKKMFEDCSKFKDRIQNMPSTISKSISKVELHLKVVPEKIAKATKRGNFNWEYFYTTMAAEYTEFITTLRSIADSITETDSVTYILNYAEVTEEITYEELEESRHKLDATIIAFLKKELLAFETMKNMWTKVQEDLRKEEDETLAAEKLAAETLAAEKLAAETLAAENKRKKMIKMIKNIGHIFTFILGIVLFIVAPFLKVGSPSFWAILVLAFLITGWCVFYFIRKCYKSLNESYDEPNDEIIDEPNDEIIDEPNDEIIDEPNDEQEGIWISKHMSRSYLGQCNTRLIIVKTDAENYGVSVPSHNFNSNTEYDTADLENYEVSVSSHNLTSNTESDTTSKSDTTYLENDGVAGPSNNLKSNAESDTIYLENDGVTGPSNNLKSNTESDTTDSYETASSNVSQ